uniref:Estrogen-related receptor gamma n=1 Tax=Sepia latimanus TaxID=3248881 RepID=A0A3Q8HEB5_SEPLA|nr:estrogen-related receptor gamma [Sepia latimanus]
METELVKCEPNSPLGLGRCTVQVLDDNFRRDVFSDYSGHDDYGSDRSYQGDSGDNISPCSNDVKPDFSTTAMISDQENPDGSKKICLVCGDVASGYHYGASSCEARKAFFKRTIQGNIEYSCPANSDCEITKRRRKACQACRFQKCLSVGMLREGVRLDRVRGGRQKYKRSPDSQPLTQYPIHSQTIIKKSCLERKPRTEKSVLPPGSDSKIMESLLAIEAQLDKLYASPDPEIPENEVKFMSIVSDLADRELVVTISWAKQVPGFASLPLGDQMNLLQHSWLEILCLNLAHRSCPYNHFLKFAEDFKIDQEQAANTYGCSPEMDNLSRKLASKITSLGVTKEEYILLKALILCNPDVTPDSNGSVKQLRDKFHDTLIEYVKTKHTGNMRRLGHLFMLLPHLTHVKLLARQYWFDVKKDGRVIMHKLFLEMLEADS